ncbi:MAG: ACP S-malonyltransferase [Anaerolineales bacterium]|nr:ACP S-malonyltransferase [Anaerolineales bacterium]
MSTAYLFPGQASQRVGMGADLYESHATARAIYDEADALLGFPLSKLCFEGPDEALLDTVNQQPAIFVTSLAAWSVLKEEANRPDPSFFAGHSLGEFSALVAAGSLSFADGVRLVRRRGELMKAAGEREPGGMAAILGLSVEELTAICEQATAATNRPVQVANDNCPGQVVISGDNAALDVATALAEAANARKVVRLKISIAAHSQLMHSAAEEFFAAVADTPIHAPQVPVIANASAQPLRSEEAVRAELRAQLTAAVRWTESMTYLLSQDVDNFVEVGPGEVLAGLMKRIDRKASRDTYYK